MKIHSLISDLRRAENHRRGPDVVARRSRDKRPRGCSTSQLFPARSLDEFTHVSWHPRPSPRRASPRPEAAGYPASGWPSLRRASGERRAITNRSYDLVASVICPALARGASVSWSRARSRGYFAFPRSGFRSSWMLASKRERDD